MSSLPQVRAAPGTKVVIKNLKVVNKGWKVEGECSRNLPPPPTISSAGCLKNHKLQTERLEEKYS